MRRPRSPLLVVLGLLGGLCGRGFYEVALFVKRCGSGALALFALFGRVRGRSGSVRTFIKLPERRYDSLGTFIKLPEHRYDSLGTFIKLPKRCYDSVGTFIKLPERRYDPVGTFLKRSGSPQQRWHFSNGSVAPLRHRLHFANGSVAPLRHRLHTTDPVLGEV